MAWRWTWKSWRLFSLLLRSSKRHLFYGFQYCSKLFPAPHACRSVRRCAMQENKPWQEIRTDVRSLYADHLGHALDLLHESLADGDPQLGSAKALHSQRCAISAIMHGFSSLEAVLNFMAYRMFTLDDAAEFIPLTKRNFFVQSIIKRWTNLKITEKCNTILSVSGPSLLPNGVHSKLSEVNNLRNWIVHGTCYHSTLLVAPSSESHVLYEVVDEEPGESWMRWSQKFPLCRFNQPLALNVSDAQTAIRVIVEVLLILSKGTGFKWFYTTCMPHLTACGLFGELECNLDAILGIEKTEPINSADAKSR